ncbi:MAG: long-chain fatty acid--CoA ligase [Polyangia bacterium]|jgi:fatty-acyl-CoA synthase|nr:long-chain fatty acid--CoA ligase [Polyangia bacterium]
MVHGNWLAKWALVAPQKKAIVDLASGRSFTYAELNGRADRLAALLMKRFGVGFGDRVAVIGANRIEQVDLLFALGKLGAMLVPINWRLSPGEVAFILKDCEPKLLLWSADVSATAKALKDGLFDGQMVGLDDQGEAGFGALLAQYDANDPALAITTEGIVEDTPLLLLYTSGTTGRPKGALLTHGTVTWNAVNTSTGWDLRHDDVTITHTPFFHTGGWNVLTLPLLHRGATVVLAERFDPGETLRAIGEQGVTVLFAVPTMFQMMLDDPALASASLGSVRFFISGGAPCPIPLIEAFAKRGVTFKQGYGLTEVGPNCFVLDARDAIRKAGAVGFPVLHLDTRIVDSSGREVARGVVGELQLRGPTVCAGYFRNPEATAKAKSADGWFSTGDLFRQDEEGYHYVVGRLKEMYISGGENVYPAEVERVLYQLEAVIEAAVVGVPDERWGEVGRAFVALDPKIGPKPSPEEILAHCRANLARYKVPKHLTILESLPKGPSGKILKQALVS